MKSLTSKLSSFLLISTLVASAPAFAVWPPPTAGGEELAVWQAVAGTISRENTDKPYKQWYSQSDFAASSFISSALSDPEKAEFCGLSANDVKSMISRLKSLSVEPIQLDSDVAKSAGFKIAHKKNPRMRYFAMSRVVFDPSGNKAWLSVELNGERGSIVRMEKSGSEWNRTSRCGGWYMPEQP